MPRIESPDPWLRKKRRRVPAKTLKRNYRNLRIKRIKKGKGNRVVA